MSALPIAMYRRVGSLSSCALSIVLSMGMVDVALAQGAESEDAIERAVVLFETAEERYREGRFDVAVQLLLEARVLHEDPTISYNLGRAYEELEQHDGAIEAYRHYLLGAPNARDRGAVEARITRLEDVRVERERRAAAERERAERERGDGGGSRDGAVEGTPEDGASRRDGADAESASGPSALPIVVLSTGVLGVGVGAVFGVLSGDARSSAVDDPVHQSARAAFRDAETFATAANVAFVVGGIIAAAGLAWLVIDLVSSGGESRAVSVRVGPGSIAMHGELP